MSSKDNLSVLRFARALADKRAENIRILDLRPLGAFTDYFIVASGTSDRHLKTLADAVENEARAQGLPSPHTEGYSEGRWILEDTGEVVVHLFLDAIREYYDLEKLWSQATRIPLPKDLFAPQASELTTA